MAYEIAGWWPTADEAMARLENDSGMSAVVDGVNRALDALEDDPYNPRLGTTVFQSEEFGGVCATPARVGDWYVFWQPGPAKNTIEIVLVHELPLDVAE